MKISPFKHTIYLGYLGPAGWHLDNQYPPECIGGVTGHIDRVILGVKHVYSNPTAKGVYHTGAFDPEGIFGKESQS